MKRVLTDTEIEYILDFLKPNKSIPIESAISIIKNLKIRFLKQLKTIEIYPELIDELKKQIEKNYRESLITPGESVGILAAQSIGERNTQSTLNSVDWNQKILYFKNNEIFIEPIGKMIDNLLIKFHANIEKIKENRTEYLPLENGYYIPSCDENGNTNWYKIEAVTKHLPVGKLVKVQTKSGRNTIATQSKSFLVWINDKFEPTQGSNIKVGDILPITRKISEFTEKDYFDLETIFPKDKYLYTTEIIKSKNFRFTEKKAWLEHNGKDFILPYKRLDTCYGKKEYFLSCKSGCIYIHTSKAFVSHITDKIKLDNNFGFIIGIYLAKGWSTKTFVGISNIDKKIRKRITDWCDIYSISYHLVISNGIYSDLKIHSTLLARMFKIISETGSENKFVPNFAYTAPKEFIKGLIDGYFSGDGTVDKKDGSIKVSSASETLTKGISFLLSYFNIFCIMSIVNRKYNNVESKNLKLSYYLSIKNNNAKIFANEFKLTENNKQNRLNTIT